MQKGHIRKECPNEIVCYECRQIGHKRGDPDCPGKFQDMDDFQSATSENLNDDDPDNENEETLTGDKNVSQMIN